jgi:hypothetical protein
MIKMDIGIPTDVSITVDSDSVGTLPLVKDSSS